MTQGTCTTDQIAVRVGSPGVIGGSCHPRGIWTLGSSETIPPCISVQMISSACEDLTGALTAKDQPDKMNDYRACLFGDGSSYEQDTYGCLVCKLKHQIHSTGENTFWKAHWKTGIAAFKNANPLNNSLWDVVIEPIDWRSYPSDSKEERDREFAVNEYYPNAPVQNIGNMTPRALRARAEPATDGHIRDIGVTFHVRENSTIGISVNGNPQV